MKFVKKILDEFAKKLYRRRFNRETKLAFKEVEDMRSGKIASKTYSSVEELIDDIFKDE